MLKKRIKFTCITGCLVMTVLFFCGCRRESDLVVDVSGSALAGGNVSESMQEVNEAPDEMRDETEKSAEQESSATIYVQVTGAVRAPGVYELPDGSRVFEAVQKAGGMTDEAAPESVNQAVLLEDGEMIVLYTQQEWETLSQEQSSAQDVSAAEDSDDRVNINTADMTLLCTIPGIGETRAQSILTYREKNGAFASIEEIKKVSGIKDGLFQKIKDKIKV